MFAQSVWGAVSNSAPFLFLGPHCCVDPRLVAVLLDQEPGGAVGIEVGGHRDDCIQVSGLPYDSICRFATPP